MKVPSKVNVDGDYWIFKIDPIGSLNPAFSKVYSGGPDAVGLDYARSLVIESIGKTGNDGAYCIKRVYDGSFIVAGYTTNNFEKDFYFRKFELAQPCVAPGGLSILTAPVCAKVSWTVEPCVWKYKLEYQEDNGPWIAIDGAISPFTITDNTVAGNGNFKWRVTSYCSPNKFTTVYGSPFSINYCNNCTCPLKVGNENDASEYGNNFLSVFPNPSDGTFKISLQIPDIVSQSTAIDILDQAGKVVSSLQATFQNGLLDQQISVKHLPAGFYWVSVTANGKIFTAKLILQ